MNNGYLKKYQGKIYFLLQTLFINIINVVIYYGLISFTNIGVIKSTVCAWFIEIIILCFINKNEIFIYSLKEQKEKYKELFACSILICVIDFCTMHICVNLLNINEIIIKFLLNFFVFLLNFIAYKLVIVGDNNDNKLQECIKDLHIKNTKKEYVINGFILILFFVITFLFLLNSPLHIWKGENTGTDSSVFKTIVLMMDKGSVPYLDSFDHKGPLLYILNYIGMQISYYRGVWIIEFINLFITLCAIYKIARLKCNKSISVFISIIAISRLFSYFECGNFVEEYALPFISISIYIFIDYLINEKINKKRLILCGFCFGSVVLLRPNMISTWIIFSIAVLIKILKEKKYSDLKLFILFFLIGIGIIVIPILTWLGVKNALPDFWNDYIVFNKLYSASEGGRATIENKWSAFTFFFYEKVLIISTIICIYLYKIHKKHIYLYYVLYIFSTLILITLSGMKYLHYGMILVPMIIFPIASIYEYLRNIKNKIISNSIIISITIFFFVIIVLPNWFYLAKTLPETYRSRDEYKISQIVQNISNVIESGTTKDDTISVYGNWNIIYVVSKRAHATKYSYQFPIGEVLPEIMNDYFKQLENEKPKMIIVQKNMYNQKIKEFLEENKYSLIWKENDDLQSSSLVFFLEND